MTYSSPRRRKQEPQQASYKADRSPWPYAIGALGLIMMLGSGAMMLGATANPWLLLGMGLFGIVFLAGLLLLLLAYALTRR